MAASRSPRVPIGALTAAVVALSLAVHGRATPGPGAVIPQRSPEAPVAGSLLVAGVGLTDPNFMQTVVLVLALNQEGAAGLVINRRSGATLASVLPGVEIPGGSSAFAFAGGPVDPTRARALVRSRPARGDAYPVLKDVFLLDSGDRLREVLARGADARETRVYAGYAGWGAGQLGREIEAGAWHVLDGDSRVVFDPNPDTLWRRQIARTNLQIARLFPGHPHARAEVGEERGILDAPLDGLPHRGG